MDAAVECVAALNFFVTQKDNQHRAYDVAVDVPFRRRTLGNGVFIQIRY